MDREVFGKQVDIYLNERPCGDAASAKLALVALYDFILTRAHIALAHPGDPATWDEMCYLVLQTMGRSPLRLILLALTKDDLKPIRAAAKYNLALTSQGFENDPEALMGDGINFRVVQSGKAEKLLSEIATSPLVKRAVAEWEKSNPNPTPTLGEE
ncbi:MAG: hypothetical protein ABI643_00380 [Candidatus Doudnabacteria bacterium]